MSNPNSKGTHPKRRLAWYENIWITLPMILLVIFGGAIGGGCGGLIWAINRGVMDRTSNPVQRMMWTGLISLAGIAVYFVIASLLFGKRDR